MLYILWDQGKCLVKFIKSNVKRKKGGDVKRMKKCHDVHVLAAHNECVYYTLQTGTLLIKKLMK